MKNYQKGFVIPLIVVLVALVVGGGAYYAYSTSHRNTENNQGNIQGTVPATNTSSGNTSSILSTNLSSTTKQQIANGTRDIAIENNVKGTRDFITEYYKSDNDPCMNKYVVESIKTSTVGLVTCQSNAMSYAVSQALISAPSASWCADSSGFTNQGVVSYQGGKYFCKATSVSIPVTPKYIPPTSTPTSNKISGSQPVADPDVIMKAQLNMARTAIENYYNDSNSYAGFCSANQNYADIKQFLVTYKYHTYTLSCQSSPTTYAISSDMMAGGFWCVDNMGYQGMAKSLNTTSSCNK